MRWVKLGSTGLDVSPICLGCMSYGESGPRHARLVARRGRRAGRSSSRRSRPASTSSTPPTCTPTAPARRSSAGRWPSSPTATRSSSPPRSTAGCARGQRRRPVAQGDPHRDRPQPAPARHGLRRPLPDPPLRPVRARRGDDGGAARRRQGRQGPLHRRLVDVRLAVRQAAVRRRGQRVDAVRLDAEPLQPAVPGGGAGDAAAVRRPGRRRDPVEPARPRPPDPAVGRDDGAQRDRRVRPDALPARRRADRRRRRRGRRRAGASAGPRSRWRGCRGTRPSTRRSSGRPSPSTSTTPWRPSTSSSPTTRWRCSRRRTCPTPIAGHA